MRVHVIDWQRPSAVRICPLILAVAVAVGGCGLASCGAPSPAAATNPSAVGNESTFELRPLPVNAASGSAVHAVPPAFSASLPKGASYASRRLDLMTEEAEPFVTRWARRAELILERLRKMLPPRKLDEIEPVKVLVFSSRQRFAAYADQFAPEHRGVVGYVDPVRREVVCLWDNREENLCATLLHELTHVVLRDFLGHRYPPPWLDEGLACYYETGVFITPPNGVEGETLEFGALHGEFAKWISDYLQADRVLDWRALATMGFGKFATATPDGIKANYATSWSLVFYLINGDSGMFRPALQLYLDEIARQPDYSTRYREAFDLALAPRAPAFLAGWKVWARPLSN